MILGAAYMLYLYRRVIFGRLTKHGPAQHPRPQPARMGGVRAAGRADAVDGHLSHPASPASAMPAWPRWCSSTRGMACRLAPASATVPRLRVMAGLDRTTPSVRDGGSPAMTELADGLCGAECRPMNWTLACPSSCWPASAWRSWCSACCASRTSRCCAPCSPSAASWSPALLVADPRARPRLQRPVRRRCVQRLQQGADAGRCGARRRSWRSTTTARSTSRASNSRC